MDLNFAEKISGYTKKQSDFLIAFLDCGIISEAAKKAQITEATAHKWLNNGLNKDLQIIKADLIEKYLNKLQLASGLAVNTLISIMKDEKNSINARLKASTTILDATLKIREQEQIIKRIEALEEKLVDCGE